MEVSKTLFATNHWPCFPFPGWETVKNSVGSKIVLSFFFLFLDCFVSSVKFKAPVFKETAASFKENWNRRGKYCPFFFSSVTAETSSYGNTKCPHGCRQGTGDKSRDSLYWQELRHFLLSLEASWDLLTRMFRNSFRRVWGHNSWPFCTSCHRVFL